MSDLDKSIHSPSSSPTPSKNQETPHALGGSLDKFGKSIEHISAVEVIETSQERGVTGPSGGKQPQKRSMSAQQSTPVPPVIAYIPETPKELIAAITPKIKEQIYNLTKEAELLGKTKKAGYAFRLQNTLKKVRALSGLLSNLVQLTVEKLKAIYKDFFPKAIDRSTSKPTVSE